MVSDLLSIHSGDFCNHGIWTYCSVPCRNVPGKNPLHLNVFTLSYWKRGIWRTSSAVATYLVTTGKEAGHATWYLEGLWYPIGVATVCLIIGLFYLKNKNNNLHD
jgi:hypothetical protein